MGDVYLFLQTVAGIPTDYKSVKVIVLQHSSAGTLLSKAWSTKPRMAGGNGEAAGIKLEHSTH